MRRAVTAAAVVVILAGCGGTTPAEDAYLAEIQQEGSAIKVTDPAGELNTGNTVCAELRNTKLPDRRITVAIMEQAMIASRINIIAALHHLCSDAATGTGYENW
jgi:hypothetical protein